MESSQKAPTKNMAVLCSLAELPDGSLRVTLDDVAKGKQLCTWQHQSLFTFKDYPPGTLAELNSLPEAELASFGYYILARLMASNGYGT